MPYVLSDEQTEVQSLIKAKDHTELGRNLACTTPPLRRLITGLICISLDRCPSKLWGDCA
ncbi:hypothetical protein H920_16931 [Fukomys damarensis]|uniref:Uncharacterized protein n=1 Tax=Fukomys damarensis TaxID=885580 RepID=A0A091CUI2_FUKDA|nr:hypothetical protein H920_16931 [Fukomys damarensis]